MGLDAEREQIKQLYNETFGRNVDRIIDKMTDSQVAVVYLRLRLQGKLNRRNTP